MKEVAKLQIKDRTELFQATAISMGMQPNVIEKDFWVCFMLPLPARYARHLYDVYNMGNSWVKERAFKRKELLEKDVAFKQKFYYAKGAHYETATLETIMLVPGERIHKELEDDYQAMRNMIYGNIPEFKDILVFLERLQEEIHGL